jgi:hypothetical protein
LQKDIIMKRFMIALGATALLVPAAAIAQPGGWQKGARGADVTQTDVLARADAQFQRMDLDRDGRVTREEAQQSWAKFRAERQQRMQARFEQMTPEQRAAVEQRRAQWAERKGDKARAGGQGDKAARANAMFGDKGYVTQAEFRERALQRFARMDLDGNGTVTAAERKQARQQRRGG